MGCSELSQWTIDDVYEQCMRVGVDPFDLFTRLLVFRHEASDLLHGLFVLDLESI